MSSDPDDMWEQNGKKILALLKELSSSQDLSLEPTDHGFHVCALNGDKKIPIMQIWPSPMDRLETRMQYIERAIVLTDATRCHWRSKLEDIDFKPTSGNKGNLKLIFGSPSSKLLTEAELEVLAKILVSMAQDISKASPSHS